MDFKNKRAREVFENVYEENDLLMKVKRLFQREFDFANTLLFFDEIQEIPDVFSFAKLLVEFQ